MGTRKEDGRTPAQDTRPLRPDELIPEEWACLGEVAAAFEAIHDDIAAAPSERKSATADDPPKPWVKLDARRSGRVMMLDGPRGSGKTSLLLTLLRSWLGETEPVAEEPGKTVLAKLATQGKWLRALPTLDFDPQPRHLHPYAWFVLALFPVVEYLEARRSGGAPTWGKKPEEKDLRGHWDELYRQALLGWDGPTTERLIQNDLDQYVFDQTQGQLGWHRLQEKWRTFVDRLLHALHHDDGLPEGGVLLFTIDDIDLQPGRVKELLLAVRLAHHPRVVFLLGGHRRDLERVLARELVEAGQYGAISSRGRLGADAMIQATGLAEAIVQKVIPEANNFEMPRLTFVEAVKRLAAPMGVKEWLQVGETGATKASEVVERVLRPLALDVEDNERVLFRDLMQVKSRAFESSIGAVVELCRRVVTRDGLRLLRESPDGRVLPHGASHVRPRPGQTSSLGRFQECQSLGWYAWNAKDSERPRWLRLSRAALVYLDVWWGLGGVPIMGDIPIAGHVFGAPGYEIDLWWPGISVRSISEATAALSWWSSVGAQIRDEDDRAWHWLALVGNMTTHGQPGPAPGHVTKRKPPDWSASFAELLGLGDERSWRDSLNAYTLALTIGLLAAPEYQFPVNRQSEILERLRDALGDQWPSFCVELDQLRGDQLKRALADGLKTTGAEVNPARLEADIQRRWPDAPWFTKANLAPLGENWLDWRFESGLTAILLGAQWRLGTRDCGTTDVYFKEFNRLVGRGPNIAAVMIGRALSARGQFFEWRRLLAEIDQRHSSSAPAFALLELWFGAVGLCDEPEWRHWFVAPGGMQLSYQGPPVTIRHHPITTLPIEWSVETAGGELDPMLAGLFLVMQSIAATTSDELTTGVTFAIEIEGPFPLPPTVSAWLDYKYALHLWFLVERKAAALRRSPLDLSSELERWRAANWVSIISAASQMVRIPQDLGPPHEFPIDLDTISLIRPSTRVREWAESIDLKPILGQDVADRWQDSFEWKRQPAQRPPNVTVHGVTFDPNEAAAALLELKARAPSTILGRLGRNAGKAIVAARPIEDLRTLESLEGVTSDTMGMLLSWVRAKTRHGGIFDGGIPG